ncbi:amidohydrolase family protein [Novosphingobium sp. LASN5T]|uniref:amidohydrolase family protein n=1 Tax=Novosphingobium sp. LASN5T TaxID=2491021 RepID=UPI000F5EE22A|nr:amidohydrolase family protein [Novosphingobium sp. LASN5T]RQW39424.1 imidazolonepropionase [Novosphingobium sp. LASN5T]
MTRQFPAFAALSLILAAAAAGPAAAQSFAITNAHVVTSGPVGEVENGTIVVRDGRIVAAGSGVAVPAGVRTIDARGATVTPGLIAVNTALGLVEVNSVDGSVDSKTTNSGISASFDVQYGLNPASTLIPIARLGGVTRAVVMPDYDDSDVARELPFAGKAAMISLGEGANILHRPGIGMMLELGEDGAARVGGSRAAEFVQLRQIFDLARQPPREEYPFELSQADLAALRPVLSGAMPLIVVVHRAADIRQVLKLASDYKLKIILSGAEEAWRVAGEIAAARVPVLINPTSNIPSSFDMLGASLQNASILKAAGVEIAIGGNDAGHRVREMRYNAGLAVSRGLPYAAGIEALTLAPARIFGVSDLLGSIAPGKAADIVIWDGDPLEPLTQPTAIFIAGKEQPLTSRATELGKRYAR